LQEWALEERREAVVTWEVGYPDATPVAD